MKHNDEEGLFVTMTQEEFKDLIRGAVNDAFVKQAIQYRVQIDANRLIPIDLICKELKLSKRKLQTCVVAGKIRSHRISNHIFFKKSELLEDLKAIEDRMGKQ